MFFHRSDKRHEIGKEFIPLHANNAASFFADDYSGYGLSAMGASFSVEPAPWDHFKEIVFEWVRQKEFPNQISRLSCLFGVSDLKDFDLWSDLEQHSNNYIYQIETQHWSKVDAGWLDDVQNSFSTWVRAARNYWQGDICPVRSRPEVLISLPAIIISEIQL